MLWQWIFAICCCKKNFKLIFFEIFTVNIQLLSWLQLSDYVFTYRQSKRNALLMLHTFFFQFKKKYFYFSIHSWLGNSKPLCRTKYLCSFACFSFILHFCTLFKVFYAHILSRTIFNTLSSPTFTLPFSFLHTIKFTTNLLNF